MTNEGQIIGESDFKIIDETELEKMQKNGEIKTNDDILNKDNNSHSTENTDIIGDTEEIEPGNLKDDLVKLGFLDYKNMSDEEKKIFDEMENEKRDKGYYEL